MMTLTQVRTAARDYRCPDIPLQWEPIVAMIYDATPATAETEAWQRRCETLKEAQHAARR